MNYISRIIAMLREEIPECDDRLLGLYALLVLSRHMNTTREDVHDAWAVWRNETNKPLPALTPEAQALDDRYVEAIIRKVSREYWSD